MKLKFIILLVFHLTSNFICAQIDENLKKNADAFYQSQYNMDFEEMLNFYHPNYIGKSNRDTLIKNIDRHFEKKNFNIRYVFPNVKFMFSSIIDIENKKYVIIKFTNTFRINFNYNISEDQAKRDIESYKLYKKYKSVKFEKERNSYYIDEYVVWVATKSKETRHQWKFYDLNQVYINLDKKLDDEILNKLGL